jgi:hypothetical protein
MRAKEFRFRSLADRRFTAPRFNFTEKIFRAGADGARYRQNFLDSCVAENIAKQIYIAGRVRPGDSRHLYVNLSRA